MQELSHFRSYHRQVSSIREGCALIGSSSSADMNPMVRIDCESLLSVLNIAMISFLRTAATRLLVSSRLESVWE